MISGGKGRSFSLPRVRVFAQKPDEKKIVVDMSRNHLFYQKGKSAKTSASSLLRGTPCLTCGRERRVQRGRERGLSNFQAGEKGSTKKREGKIDRLLSILEGGSERKARLEGGGKA